MGWGWIGTRCGEVRFVWRCCCCGCCWPWCSQTLGDAMSRQMADGLTTPRPHHAPSIRLLIHLSPPCTPTTSAGFLLLSWMPTNTRYGEEGTASCIAVRAALHRPWNFPRPCATPGNGNGEMAMDKAMAMAAAIAIAIAIAMALEMPVAHGQRTARLEPVPSGSPPC